MTGAGTFVPQAKFFFNRNYVKGINFRFDPVTAISLIGNTYGVVDVPNNVFVAVEIRPEVLEWSSNTYSLDHVITSSIYRSPILGPDNPLPYVLSWEYDALDGFPYLTYRPFGATGTQHYRETWERVGSGYWYQPPW